jgi:CRP-like cAMP-binding protein
MHADNTELLAQLPVLDGVRPEVVDWFATHVERVTFEPGEQLVTEGHDDRDCYLLVEGDVEVVKHGQLTDTDHGGGVTGELALLYRHPRSATATATTPVTALRLCASDFDTLAAESPDLARDAAEAIIDYLRFRFGFEPPGPWVPPAR